MINTKRLGHVTFETSDMDRQSDHYLQVLGLVDAGREGRRRCFATTSGVLAVVLEDGPVSRCTRIGFQARPGLDHSDIVRELARFGIAADIQSDPLPGVPVLTAFVDPRGTIVELFSDWQFVPTPASTSGVEPVKLGHVALVSDDPDKLVSFYSQILSFRVSDRVGDAVCFLRCSVDHHSISFVRGARDQLHHIAFEVRDAAHLHVASDLLARHGHSLIWGPVRHGPGHNVATYHRDTDDHIVELFFDMDRMYDEELGYFEPRPWHTDRPQLPKIWDRSKPRDRWGLPPTPDWARQIS